MESIPGCRVILIRDASIPQYFVNRAKERVGVRISSESDRTVVEIMYGRAIVQKEIIIIVVNGMTIRQGFWPSEVINVEPASFNRAFCD